MPVKVAQVQDLGIKVISPVTLARVNRKPQQVERHEAQQVPIPFKGAGGSTNAHDADGRVCSQHRAPIILVPVRIRMHVIRADVLT